MNTLQIWRRTVRALVAPLEAFIDQRNRRLSLSRPVVVGSGRDALRYMEKGRSVVVPAEMLSGKFARAINRSTPLTWAETGIPLSSDERGRVFEQIESEVGTGRVQWK
jgi:hypothetical protein